MEFLRIAVEDDELQVYQLITDLENTTIDRFIFSNIYKANINNPNIYYFVYEKYDNILGFVSVHIQKLLHHNGNIAEVQELIVSEEARRCGIGSKLLKKAKEISIENNCTQLEVCCNQRRILSHKFYKSQGMINSHYKFCMKLK